jgi:hypothetical protein
MLWESRLAGDVSRFAGSHKASNISNFLAKQENLPDKKVIK